MTENLYQQNTDIIKGFFRKPIVLATSIVMFATIFLNVIWGVFVSTIPELRQFISRILTMEGSRFFFKSSDVSFDVDIPVISILFAVAFLLFYIFSRNPERRLNCPAILYKVVSIVQLVFDCILCASVVLFMSIILIYMFIPQAQFIIILVPILAATIAVVLISSISRVMFANSIKKSITGIYLYRNGAKAYAVIQFITVGISLLAAVSSFILISVFSSQLNHYFQINQTLLFLPVITFAISIPCSLFEGILAIKYDSYIKKMSQNFIAPVQQPVYQTAYQNPSPEVYNSYEPQQYEQPSAQYEPQSQAVFCSNCGRQLNPDDYFCNHCGTPVKK